jgi:hypothetical protein
MLYDRLLNNWDKFMADLGDELSRERRIAELEWWQVYELLESAVVFNIDNVNELLNSTLDGHHSPLDLINIRPVYPIMWMEYKGPLESKRAKIIWADGSIHDSYSVPIRGTGSLVFVNPDEETAIQMAVITLGDDKFGDFLFKGFEIWECELDGTPRAGYPACDYLRFIQEKATSPLLAPAFNAMLALTFLHCKNVTIETVNPDKKLQKARTRKGKLPLVTYKVLNVIPIQHILKREGKSDEVGLKKAMHICRGHFKDFSEKGLFGKYHGVFWWESQVRGKLEEGQVRKYYKVHGGE